MGTGVPNDVTPSSSISIPIRNQGPSFNQPQNMNIIQITPPSSSKINKNIKKDTDKIDIQYIQLNEKVMKTVDIMNKKKEGQLRKEKSEQIVTLTLIFPKDMVKVFY
jgi:hypothetical protein